jgi:ubiquinone/menaquinone biosynthesis C-methylase UbiE
MINFDERAKDWDSDPAKVERARVVASAIRSRIALKPGMRAFEYGCGTGLLSFALQQEFAAITLADTSQGMLDVLAVKISNAGLGHMRPLLLDLASEPAPAEQFDVTYSLMTMHHIPDTAIVLRKFYSLLHINGFLCIADLEKENGSFHGPDVTDVHKGFGRAALQRQLETAGFAQVRFSSVFSVKRMVDGLEKSFPLFLMVAQKQL